MTDKPIDKKETTTHVEAKKTTARKVIIYIVLVLVVLIFLPPSLALICHTYNKFKAPEVRTVQGVDVTKVNLGYVCDEKDRCIRSYILHGYIDTETVNTFKQKETEIIKSGLPLCLWSYGGNAEDALTIAEVIRAREIPTCVGSRYRFSDEAAAYLTSKSTNKPLNGVCQSACGLLLLSGKERVSIGEDIEIGVHSPTPILDLCFCTIDLPRFLMSTDEVERVFLHPENEVDRQAYKLLYDKLLTVDRDDMYILSANENRDYRVFNTNMDAFVAR